MEYRNLGSSGLTVSAVGLGAWAIGGGSWGEVDDQESIAAVHRAIELGVTFIDTAPVYGRGRSEEVVGRALEGRREAVVLATKFGIVWDEGNEAETRHDGSRDGILREVEISLGRLRTDHIDLYQHHWPDPETDIAETARTVADLHEQGAIRAIGVSNYSVEQMREWLDYAPLHSLQPPYSMLRRDIEEAILPFCREHDIATVVYSPLHKGLLTGKFTAESTFTDLRKGQADFEGERFLRNLRIVEALRAIADRHGRTAAQLAINWTIHQPGVTVAICGARRASQVEENVGGADWLLTDQDAREIEQALTHPPRG